MGDKNAANKSIGFLQGLAIVVGMIIGSGIFLKPGVVLGEAGSTGMALMAWILGGVVTLCSALSIAEIASNIPRAGGLYTYLDTLYGEKWGFLLGWVQSVISYPASVAAQGIAFATYASFFLPQSFGESTLAMTGLALGVMLFVLVMNVLSTRCGGFIQVFATVGKLIPIVAILGIGLFSGVAPGANGMSMVLIGEGKANIGAAILSTLWAYDGWIGVTNMAGEMKDPKKNLPRVISVGIVFVVAVYALFNLVLFNALPAEQLVASATPGADAAVALFGQGGATFLTAGIMISVFGSLNGYLMTAARVPQAMAERKQLPLSGVLAKIHPKFGTPANALIMQFVLATVYVMSGSFNYLTDMLMFVLWIFFTLGVVGVFVLRKRGLSEKQNYRVPLYPITPIIGIVGSLYILVSTVLGDPALSLIGLAVSALGFPVYFWLKKKN
jgi:APA family basic amino acid/polyamine antiporter